MTPESQSVNYVAVKLDDIVVGAVLPATVYLSIEDRYVVFRAQDHAFDKQAYARLEARQIRRLYIQEKDRERWKEWVASNRKESPHPQVAGVDTGALQVARDDARRRMLDVFSGGASAQTIAPALDSSRRLVIEIMRIPYAAQTLSHLQSFSKGAVEHSINVSVLSTCLAMQLGHTSAAILSHVAAGGLMHDIGKARIPIADFDTPEHVAEKMKAHPAEGAKLLEQVAPIEVRRIVAQHHERFNGTGFPEGLRGNKIDELARIVAIANLFDELVGEDQGPISARQSRAVEKIEASYAAWFEPAKLEAALLILSAGI